VTSAWTTEPCAGGLLGMNRRKPFGPRSGRCWRLGSSKSARLYTWLRNAI